MRIALGAVIIFLVFACEHVKPYEKEYLVHPLMDDSELKSLQADLPSSAISQFERLGSAQGGGNATSCPTCGG